MTRHLDYRWNLRHLMADRRMFATTDLSEPLAQRGIELSSSQIYRLVAERPERLSLKVLVALLDILECRMEDLIQPVVEPVTELAAGSDTQRRGGRGNSGIGAARPKRAQISRSDR